MVITVTCWSCSTSFPVDTNKIPVGGVNARCSSCGDIFRVERPEEEAPHSPPPAEPAAEAWTPEPEDAWSEQPAVEDAWSEQPAVEDTWSEQPSFEESAEPDLADPMALPAEPAPSSFAPPEPEPAAPAVSGFSFGKRDPKDRARRLARVLVSDMISYNPERHERALANGSLKEDFEEEIEKSWKEFVEQVGEEMANENPFWVEALNDVLAKGEQIF